MKIYLASSWRNPAQSEVLLALRNAGHMVYDFKNPKAGDNGFSWKEAGLPLSEEGTVTPRQLQKGLEHSRAVDGFQNDFGAMQWADAGVLLLPSGRSAHLEAGWMAGAGKPVFVLAPEKTVAQRIEPELMYGLLEKKIHLRTEDVIAALYDMEQESEHLKYGG
jgi:hypothetical protein